MSTPSAITCPSIARSNSLRVAPARKSERASSAQTPESIAVWLARRRLGSTVSRFAEVVRALSNRRAGSGRDPFCQLTLLGLDVPCGPVCEGPRRCIGIVAHNSEASCRGRRIAPLKRRRYVVAIGCEPPRDPRGIRKSRARHFEPSSLLCASCLDLGHVSPPRAALMQLQHQGQANSDGCRFAASCNRTIPRVHGTRTTGAGCPGHAACTRRCHGLRARGGRRDRAEE